MIQSRTSFVVTGTWFGMLTGILEAIAFLRFPHLANPDLPWIAILFATAIFSAAGIVVALLVRPSRTSTAIVNFCFALLMFYDVATVGVADHGERIILRGVALALSAVIAFMAWGYFGKLQRFYNLSMVWLALFALFYAGIPPVVRAFREHRQLSRATVPGNAPNVLLVVIDALRADHLSTYGYARNTSPNLTQFASRGTTFRNAISASSWTLPSHASIVTGRLPHEHHADRPDRYLDDRLPTVAEAFAAAGYHTAGFSANWWLFARRLGFGRGFMHFQDFDSVSSAVMQTNLGQRIRNAIEKVDPRLAPLGRSRADRMDRDILGWIDGHPGPFFIMANYMDVHEPYTPPLECFHQFSKLQRPAGQVFLGNPRIGQLTPAEVANEMDAYDASIHCMDEGFATLLAGLRQRGLLENTFIVVTSDHGDAFDEHGLMSHGTTLYRELIHVPLIMVGPRIPTGAVVQRPVSLVSLPATLLALVGKDPSKFPGVPLNLVWTKPQDVIWPDPVAELFLLPSSAKDSALYTSLASLVTPEWQLIEGGKRGHELYHWPDDQLESHDFLSHGDGVSSATLSKLENDLERFGQPAVNASAKPAPENPTKQTARQRQSQQRVLKREQVDREKNNEYLKALGYIPN